MYMDSCSLRKPLEPRFTSIGEDVAVIAGLWTALQHPLLFLILLSLFIITLFWLLPSVWRAIRSGFIRLGRLISRVKTGSEKSQTP